MAKKKLSEELRFCIEQDGCSKCSCFETQSKLTCPGLLQKAYEVVKRYEEIEGQGKIHITSLSFGQEVYLVDDSNVIYKYKVVEMSIKGMDIVYISVAKNGSIKLFNEEEISITVFLTKEAAEKTLKEMEDRENGEID